jgi:hypothetical protein
MSKALRLPALLVLATLMAGVFLWIDPMGLQGASSPAATYSYRAPITLTMSGDALGQGSPVCLAYDPTPLIDLGYVRTSTGTLDDVRLDDLSRTDRWLTNAGGCLWGITGTPIADGQSETWSFYTGHPSDTRAPMTFLTRASDSIDISDDASLQLDSGWWAQIEDLVVSEAPDDALILVSKKASGASVNYELGIDASGYFYVTVTPLSPSGPDDSGAIYLTGDLSASGFTYNACSSYYGCLDASTSSWLYTGSSGTPYAYMTRTSWGLPATAEVTCFEASVRRWYDNQYGYYTFYVDVGNSQEYTFTHSETYGSAPTSQNTYTFACHADSTDIDAAFLNQTQEVRFRWYSQYGTARRASVLSLRADYTYLAAGSPVTVTASQDLTGGVTHTLVGEYDSNTVRLFVDDILAASGAAGSGGFVYTGADNLSILAASGSSDYYRASGRIRLAPSSATADVLDLDFYADHLTQTQLGAVGNGWVHQYTVSDLSGEGNDATWTLTAPADGLTISLGPLSSVEGLPTLLVESTFGDSIGDTPNLNTSATSKTFPGFASIQAAIDEVGLPDAPLWFLFIITVVGLVGGPAVRGSKMPMIGGIILVLAIVAGGAFGLFPWYYAALGGVLIMGVLMAAPILGART